MQSANVKLLLCMGCLLSLNYIQRSVLTSCKRAMYIRGLQLGGVASQLRKNARAFLRREMLKCFLIVFHVFLYTYPCVRGQNDHATALAVTAMLLAANLIFITKDKIKPGVYVLMLSFMFDNSRINSLFWICTLFFKLCNGPYLNPALVCQLFANVQFVNKFVKRGRYPL